MKSLVCADLDVIVEEICDRIRVYSTVPDFNEANTIFLLIDPVLPGLGWNHTDVKEVHKEYSPKGVKKRADISLMFDGAPKLSLEAKALGTDLDQKEWINQACNNAYQTGAPWALLTDGAEYRLFRIRGTHELRDSMLLSFNINDPDREATLRNLKLISREMHVDKDHLLYEAHDRLLKDRQLAAIAHDPTSTPELIATYSKLTGLTEKETISFFKKYRPSLDANPSMAAMRCDVASEILAMSLDDSSPPESATVKGKSIKKKPKKVGWSDLFNAGYINYGMTLYLTGYENDTATVHDGDNCNWNGKICSYNSWAEAVSDGGIKDVYARAVVRNGKPIKHLRAEMERKRVVVQPVAIESQAVPAQSESMALT